MSAPPPASAPGGRWSGGKLRQDVFWNIGSLALLGVGGIILNILIASAYGPAPLGAFNQVLAVFVFFSQFAAGGVHLSTLKGVAETHDDRRACDTIVTAALVLTLALAAAFTLLFWWAREPISMLLDSPAVSVGLAWATPGLFCFALNKTLLGVLNGLRHMRAYAVAQALRPALMIAAFAVVATLRMPPERLPVVLSAAEAAVLVFLVIMTARHIRWMPGAGLGRWMRRHLDFGVRSAGSGVLLELNTRVDVLMLGCFGSDALVGVYSFAAMLIEGVAQLPIVLRTNLNPIIVQYLASSDRAALAALVGRGRRLTYTVMLAVGGVAVLVYPLGVGLVTNQSEFAASSWPFAILMVGLVASSGYVPFGQILLQAGHPGTHTLMTLAVVAFNILGNLLLIPFCGAPGAALATAAAYVFSVWLLRVLSRRVAGVAL